LSVGLTVILVIGDNYMSYAQLSQNIDKEHKVAFYGCEKSGNGTTFRCDPLNNKTESYEITGISSKVYNITREPTFIDGTQGKALEMHANRLESIKYSNNPVANPAEFSISFWIKKPSQEDANTYGDVFSHSSAYAGQGWHFDMFKMANATGEAVSFNIYGNGGKLYTTPEVPISPDIFTHIVGTFDGSTIKIFKDGILYGKTEFDSNYIPDPKVPFKIGGGAYCVTCNPWTGIIDDLRFYRKALSENEVKDIFLKKSSSIVSNSLIGHWTFDGTLNDISGYGNHGTAISLIGSMTFAPDGRLFFTEKNTGKIRILKDNKVLETPFATISDYYVNWEQGLLGLTVDPNFEQNHFIYLYYTSIDDKTGEPFNRVVRFTAINNEGVNMIILIDKIPASKGFHSGGALAFGKDDKLYITVGDMASNKTFQQDPSSLLGKVLRINRDGTIPSDNPFPNSPVYNIGHRNMYGVAFDKDGIGIVTENGAHLYDEINSLEKGANYGFPTFQPTDEPPELSNSSLSIKPLRSYRSVIAPTQAIYYDGDKIPELKDKFLFGTVTGNIYALNIEKDTKQIVEEKILLNVYEDVIGIAQSPAGDIYYGGFGIYKLKSLDASTKKQILFPVEVISSSASGFNLEYLQLDSEKKKVSVNIDAINVNNTNDSPSPFFTIRIPKELLGEIFSVSIIGGEQKKEWELTKGSNFTIDSSALDHTSVSLAIPYTIASIIQPAKIIEKSDSVRPSVDIINPEYPLTLPSQSNNTTIIVNGSAYDSESGIQKVEAFTDTFPLDDKYPFNKATPIAPGNWSKWSIPLNINNTGYNRILVKATDNVGNENWDETTINILGQRATTAVVLPEQAKNRIAFVEPTFTDTAYSGNSGNAFYSFYPKYKSTPNDKNVTTGVYMLRNIRILPDRGLATDAITELDAKLIPLDTDVKRYLIPFTEHVEKFAPNDIVTLIRDEDVHDGHIFKDDGSNAYDVLFLLHSEYVTQNEYDNFKRFVRNGGTIVFIDGNVFYAEVLYDKNKHAITLLKGHDWEFDGKVARKSISERWFDETKEWVGSNFLVNDISDKVYFTNNPFNYTHFEENYVTNSKATVLINYGAIFPKEYPFDSHRNAKIATYEMNYGKGKVIVIGLYGQEVADNEAFLKFFDNTILQHALAPSYKLDIDGNEFVIYWKMETGRVTKVEVDKQSKSLSITLEKSEQKEDNLLITLPKKLIDIIDTQNGEASNFTITVNHKKVVYNETAHNLVDHLFTIPLSSNASENIIPRLAATNQTLPPDDEPDHNSKRRIIRTNETGGAEIKN
jgi:glucose/arabinose dehydrogenase